jgi:hypothetical protein
MRNKKKKDTRVCRTDDQVEIDIQVHEHLHKKNSI